MLRCTVLPTVCPGGRSGEEMELSGSCLHRLNTLVHTQFWGCTDTARVKHQTGLSCCGCSGRSCISTGVWHTWGSWEEPVEEGRAHERTYFWVSYILLPLRAQKCLIIINSCERCIEKGSLGVCTGALAYWLVTLRGTTIKFQNMNYLILKLSSALPCKPHLISGGASR